MTYDSLSTEILERIAQMLRWSLPETIKSASKTRFKDLTDNVSCYHYCHYLKYFLNVSIYKWSLNNSMCQRAISMHNSLWDQILFFCMYMKMKCIRKLVHWVWWASFCVIVKIGVNDCSCKLSEQFHHCCPDTNENPRPIKQTKLKNPKWKNSSPECKSVICHEPPIYHYVKINVSETQAYSMIFWKRQ